MILQFVWDPVTRRPLGESVFSPTLDGFEHPDGELLDALPTAHGYALGRFWTGGPVFSTGCLEARVLRRHRVGAFEAMGVPVMERLTGGETVYVTSDDLNFSLALDAGYRCMAAESQLSLFSAALVEILNHKFRACFTTGYVKGSICDGRYNICWRDKKVGGTAMTCRRRGVLLHGWIMTGGRTDLRVAQVESLYSTVGISRMYRSDALATLEEAVGCEVPVGDTICSLWDSLREGETRLPSFDSTVRSKSAMSF